MEVIKGVKVIEGLNRGKFPYCNVVKVGEFIIDAGAGMEVMRTLRDKKLILSHLHPDHSSGAWLFKEILAPEAGKLL